MKEFNIKELLENKTAINCKTKKQTKKLFKELQILGYVWNGGEKLNVHNTYYDFYQEKTCYTVDITQGTITYDDITYFKEKGYKVLTLKDIKIKKEEK